ncbi:hypothetical protein [Sphaerisporangium aureirubrum]|uniref:Uncharacterized protein n=1 Tax=Sphaerisporangium aureirubrum TaxID=1544736 RepID=A0ABW1NDP4_9ACTN
MTPQPRNDARLWAGFISMLRAAHAPAPEVEAIARRLVAAVRADRDPDLRTWAPGKDIPTSVTAVYDLDGDIWERPSTGPEDLRRWRMRNHDPEQHETAAGGAHTTTALLSEYGPLTELTSQAQPATTKDRP